MDFKNSARTISITSGKGGVGKTTLTTNIAYGLAQQGQRVLIFDADLGMANVDLLYGIKSQGHIGEVIDGQKELRDILIELSKNIYLIPGGSGVLELQTMNLFQKRAMLESINELPFKFDTILVDTAPGLSEHVLYFNSAADENYLVLTPDPASFADGYALLKVLHLNYKKKNFSVIVNQVKDDQQAIAIFSKFQDIVAQFLHVRLNFCGAVHDDVHLKTAVRQQRLILKQDPMSVSSRGIKSIVSEIVRTSQQPRNSNRNNNFWVQIVGQA